MLYIHQQAHWPQFIWRQDVVATPLAAVRHRQGRLIGRMEALGFELRTDAMLVTLTEDVVKSSAIEGEDLDTQQVRSSIARRLGLEIKGLIPSDCHVDGVVELMLDATQNYAAPLTADRLFGWHAALFPGGRSGLQRITVADWRNDADGPMQVVSGPFGREKVHYEAPAAERVADEMAAFLAWFEGPFAHDPVLKAALAHLWFVTIHPFEDGNGRIARAIADMALARSEGVAERFYSMSAEIRQQRSAYYDVLEQTQKGDMDVTGWLLWFLACLDSSISRAEAVLSDVLAKAAFWERHKAVPLNDRQRMMVHRLLDGFEGKLTTSKWAKITKCSQDTALRDIERLIALGLLVKEDAGGRSTSYALTGSPGA